MGEGLPRFMNCLCLPLSSLTLPLCHPRLRSGIQGLFLYEDRKNKDPGFPIKNVGNDARGESGMTEYPYPFILSVTK